MHFDVFLSYRHTQAAAARSIFDKLKGLGLTVFFDEDALRPGGMWGPELEQVLRVVPAVAVVVGPDDIGDTQEREVRFALQQHQERRIPVMQVILPGASPSNRVGFLAQHTFINLNGGHEDEQLDRLYFGITGRHRSLPEPVTPPHLKGIGATIEETIETLTPRLLDGRVAFFVGSGVSGPPATNEMAAKLRGLLRRTDAGMPELPTLELAGTCYAVDFNDELAVEERIRDFLSVQLRVPAPLVHQKLAAIAAAVQARRTARREAENRLRSYSRDTTLRGQPPFAQQREMPLLIVTTNYDVLLERTLLQHGVSFLRVVQHHGRNEVVVNDFSVELSGQELRLADRVYDPHSCAQVGEAIQWVGTRPVKSRSGRGGLPLVVGSSRQSADVVLYKAHGSSDVEGSCFISCDHHLRFFYASIKEKCIPDSIAQVLQNSTSVFVGYGFFDPVLRLIAHTILRERVQALPNYVVKPRPSSAVDSAFHDRIEAALWDDVRLAWANRRMTLVEADEATFLGGFLDRFGAQPQLGVGA